MLVAKGKLHLIRKTPTSTSSARSCTVTFWDQSVATLHCSLEESSIDVLCEMPGPPFQTKTS
ncbi:hypothetical protein MPTK1_4g03970 [Marchantia polymorpha subsp. ruderalis]|uniref:Uncharacterized protein n=2 Tax=Marchantia polymorpha TaxID=3197 RepID=A0AAF6B631_MARPO|nr:hypothetical protein MARPO_0044s0077 [Marchantia polymorpha]BBN07465.1 hypothetical protein Mp_4g03970 [Marchantia polymorpha subsp. ruderalis]|eukprot:PTQ39636.1 hypothetical protein MARPO_0044s0077 [Marchantia polymorpha]